MKAIELSPKRADATVRQVHYIVAGERHGLAGCRNALKDTAVRALSHPVIGNAVVCSDLVSDLDLRTSRECLAQTVEQLHMTGMMYRRSATVRELVIAGKKQRA